MSNYISEWLVLGPIFNVKHQSFSHHAGDGHPTAKQIINDIVSPFGGIRPLDITRSLCVSPEEGDAVQYRSSFYDMRCTWQRASFHVNDWENPHDTGDDIRRLHDFSNTSLHDFSDKHHCLAFFLVYIHSPDTRQTELFVRNDDSLRVWLNGEEIDELKFAGEMEVDVAERSAEVCLYKGTNVLLAAVAETHYEWGFSARFVNDEGLEFATMKPAEEPFHPPGRDAVQSLQHISEMYSIFEKGQVLTHDQLNSIAEYLDDQTRLTRVNLIGVGILCGFDISLEETRIEIGKGVGVTTDGDLVVFSAPRIFEWFTTFDESRPRYAPFYGGDTEKGKLIELYELLDERPYCEEDATPLATLSNFQKMAVILYVESYITDRDICSATDCDNLGQERVNKVKVLLADCEQVASLAIRRGQNSEFSKILADRPVLSPLPFLTGEAGTGLWYKVLQDAYWDACERNLNKFFNSLPLRCKPVASFIAGPLEGLLKKWKEILMGIHDRFNPEKSPEQLKELLKAVGLNEEKYPLGIQYYYDLLKTLLECCNSLGEAAVVAGAVCAPDYNLFPKHLLVGLASGRTDRLRTSFQPAVCSKAEQALETALQLLEKIDWMIGSFEVPAVDWVAVTPTGRRGDCLLNEGQTPYYYSTVVSIRPETAVLAEAPVLQRPEYKRERFMLQADPAVLARLERVHESIKDVIDRSSKKEMSGLFEEEAKRQEPLKVSLCDNSFFRIEGHLGQDVEVVTRRLLTLILCYNLPFAVLPVTLKNEMWEPKSREHAVAMAGERLVKMIGDAKVDDSIEIEKLTQVIDKMYTELLRAKLNFNSDQWRDFWMIFDIINFARASGLNKIAAEEARELLSVGLGLFRRLTQALGDRMQFSDLFCRNPGFEHCGGVSRGGTFVIVDYEGTVVADFMLSDYISMTRYLKTEAVTNHVLKSGASEAAKVAGGKVPINKVAIKKGDVSKIVKDTPKPDVPSSPATPVDKQNPPQG
ncbi:hypothetical protein Geob_3745 [Geotalea daltonii FRC-32]|uniref:Uncharacterized protein n=1 Tax=Geotalea daltonii (strain DSM 22248 / JCM 15807 / FRC-32) TaxID=316067 RepID=B9M762_GEODF|nr:hypothetical protein [Geotalea daltonii]ACM22083.1 hypothetical protein Geob_3745 [Geotalea daltonii FRC-32]